MAIYKNANLDISVSAEQNPSYNAKPSVQFSTQDKNTAKYTFTVKQNNKPVDLTGVTASVTLYSEDKSVFQSDATITSATEGKIEYVIPSEAIRHHGKTRGDLKLTYSNGDVLGGLRFSFNIEQALIDRAAGVVGGVYIRDFETLKAEIQKTADSIKDIDVVRIDTKLNELEEQIGEGVGVDEQARQEIQEVTAQLADTVKEVNGVKPANGKVTIPIPEVDTANLRTKTEKLKLEDMSSETLAAIEGGEGTSFNLLSIPQDKSVTPDKTNFLNIGKNLFNPNTRNMGKNIDSYGNLADLASYDTSDYIKVSPGDYAITKSRRIAIYNSNKAFVSLIDVTDVTPRIVSIANEGYIRVSFPKTDIGTSMVEKGNAHTKYEPYGFYLDSSLFVEAANLKPNSIGESILKPESVTIDKTTFVKRSKNLFDYKAGTPNKHLDSYGKLIDLAGYTVSDFIPVTSGTYAVSPSRRIAIYNTSKTFANYVDVPDLTSKVVNVSSDGFIRVSFQTPSIDTAIVSEGSVLPDYEPYGIFMKPEIAVPKAEEAIKRVISIESKISTLITDKPMVAVKNGNSYKIKFRYNNAENMVLEFNQLGVNKIIHPRKIYRETANSLTDDFSSPTLWYEVLTDWISPYAGIIATNGTTTFTGTVGGNHGTNGSAGYATARNLSATMYVDGMELTENQKSNCSAVKLIVKNYISASNRIDPSTGSKSDSLLETVVYTITPSNIEVTVYLTALEDLTINGYVGLQMTTNMMTGEAYFNDSANKYSPNSTRRNSLALPFKGDRMIYGNANNVFVTYTNRELGIGDLSKKGTEVIHHLSESNKLYSHLLGQPLSLKTNESVFYGGGYTIAKPLTCEGAEKAYFIKLNGRTIYCVDFLNAYSNALLELPIKFLGRQVEVIEKTNSITCDSVIGGNGLKISANGWGTLKFTVKE